MDAVAITTSPLMDGLLGGAVVLLVLAVVTWVISLPLRDVSIVDIAWSLLVMGPGVLVALLHRPPIGPALVMLAVGAAWAVRLSLHILLRHWGEPEDRRYQAIRARNQPHFEWKSLYLIFVFQAVLAWLVSLPLVAALSRHDDWSVLSVLGLLLAVFGLVFEAIADAQLTRFKRDPSHRGEVLDTGLWRFTRHPNYFGEFCMWWGLWVASGVWWAIASPLVMSILLLRVSGVTLLEKDISERRPAYRKYVLSTNAFFPGSPRR